MAVAVEGGDRSARDQGDLVAPWLILLLDVRPRKGEQFVLAQPPLRGGVGGKMLL